MTKRVKAAEETFLSRLKLDRALSDLRSVSRHFMRTAGSEAEEKAALYMAEELKGCGFSVKIEEFPITAWIFRDASFALTSPTHRSWDCMPWGYSPATPEPVEGPLIDVGQGYPEDFSTLDTAGRVLLMDFPMNSDFQYSLLCASRFAPNARAVVIASKVPKAVRIEAASFRGRPAPWPVLGIPHEAGLEIRDLVGRGEILARISVEAETREGVSQNVVGRLGGENGRRRILVTGHHDAWWWGANDNATAEACLLETARAFAEERPRQSVDFISWGSEESGYLDYFYFLGGSRSYIQRHREDLSQIAGVVNGEVMGAGDVLVGEGTCETTGFLEAICRDLGMKGGLRNRHFVKSPPGPFSDHWPFAVEGVASICWLWMFYREYHSNRDAVDIIRRDRLGWALRAYALSAFRLAQSERFPYRLKDYTGTLLKGRRPPANLRALKSPDVLVPPHLGLEEYARLAKGAWSLPRLLSAVRELHRLARSRIDEEDTLRVARELNRHFLRADGESGYEESILAELPWMLHIIQLQRASESIEGIPGATVPSDLKEHFITYPKPVYWTQDLDMYPLRVDLRGRLDRLHRAMEERVRNLAGVAERLVDSLRPHRALARDGDRP